MTMTTNYARWIATNADGGKQLGERIEIVHEGPFGDVTRRWLYFIHGYLRDSGGYKLPNSDESAERFLRTYKKSIK